MTEIKNLLRPNQVKEAQGELASIKEMLNAPPHIGNQISDRRGMGQRGKRLEKQLDEFSPRAYKSEEKDAAVARFNQLAQDLRVGMPSSEEMRRNPPGAVQKNLAWEKRNKENIKEYKHRGLRLLAGGDEPNSTYGDAITNVELLRPLNNSEDLSMQGAQIPRGTDYHGLNNANSVTFSEEHLDALEQIDPELVEKAALLTTEERQRIKEILDGTLSSTPVEEDEPEAELDWNEMRALAKKNGINTFHMSKVDLFRELHSKGWI